MGNHLPARRRPFRGGWLAGFRTAEGSPAAEEPPQVAEWAGNSAPVLLRTYAKCVHSREELNRRRIEDTLRDGDDDGEARRGFGTYSAQPPAQARQPPHTAA